MNKIQFAGKSLTTLFCKETFQDLVGHVVYLPEPHDAVVLIGRQEAQVGHFGGEVLGARSAREEVVDVVDHGHDDSFDGDHDDGDIEYIRCKGMPISVGYL